jgi:hypothetical protein
MEKEKNETEEERKGKEHDIQDHDHKNIEQQKSPEMQSEDSKDANSGRTISGRPPTTIESGPFIRVQPPNPPPRRRVPLPTAQDVTGSTNSFGTSPLPRLILFSPNSIERETR